MPKKQLSFRALTNSHHQNLIVKARRLLFIGVWGGSMFAASTLLLSSRIKKRDDGELIGAYFYDLIP
jgi:hypothetical protein